jgi:RNA polymerase sigma-70 factor, ECF subfamily
VTREQPAIGTSAGSEVAGLVDWLVSEFSTQLYRQAISIVQDHALAEDVVQESLLRAWQAHESYRGEAPLGAWVMRIGHNTAISALRRSRDQPTDPVLLPEGAMPGFVDRTIDRLEVEAVWEVLGQVDALSRTIVVLRDVEGYSYREIADITGSTIGVVKTRLFRTRRRLADSLKEWK